MNIRKINNSRAKVQSIKDNNFIDKRELESLPCLTNKIIDKTLGQLENEGVFLFPEMFEHSKDITQDQVILRSANDKYQTSNVMGFLGFGEEQLAIVSRFSTGKQDFFFQYLLEKVLDIPNIVDLPASINWNKQLINLSLFLFPYYLKGAIRKGVFKTYVRKNYNDSNVKGTIDIARHIKNNTPFIGNIAYSQQEFSYDNYLMELIRHTIEFIKNNDYGSQILKNTRNEISAVIEVTAHYNFYDKQKIIIQNINNPIRHAYYHEYRILQRLCLMILQNSKSQFGVGIHQIYGILFDGAWLWEEYVNSLISNSFYHPMNKSSQGSQYLFKPSQSKGNIGLIYPDFISRNNNQKREIADAKYKPMCNIGNKDYLQLLAYMFRFDAKRGFYLYPEKNGNDVLRLKMLRGLTYEENVETRNDIMVIKCGLKIANDATNYNDFVSKMRNNEANFIKNILQK